MKLIARTHPRCRPHVIVDNAYAHKTPEVQAWLARHRRIQLHFTPTGSSWLNQLETWFSILSGGPSAVAPSPASGLSSRTSSASSITGTTTASPSFGSRPPTRPWPRYTVKVPMRQCTRTRIRQDRFRQRRLSVPQGTGPGASFDPFRATPPRCLVAPSVRTNSSALTRARSARKSRGVMGSMGSWGSWVRARSQDIAVSFPTFPQEQGIPRRDKGVEMWMSC